MNFNVVYHKIHFSQKINGDDNFFRGSSLNYICLYLKHKKTFDSMHEGDKLLMLLLVESPLCCFCVLTGVPMYFCYEYYRVNRSNLPNLKI